MLFCEHSILAALVRPDLPHASNASQMEIHQRIVQQPLRLLVTGNVISSFITQTDLAFLVVTFFTWSLKVRFSSSVTPRNLTVDTFVRIESRNSNVNCIFLVGDYRI